MGIVGSLLGGAVGWWLGGPIGVIVGVIVGNIAEQSRSASEVFTDGDPSRQARGGFMASLLVLIAAVMKADGKVVKSELDYVKSFLNKSLGPDKATESLLLLRDILKQQIPVHDVCHQIRVNLDYSSRLELLHFLFGLGMSDGIIDKAELHVIVDIATHLGISSSDISSIQGMFYDDLSSAYKVLEIESDVSNDEVKKAYRKMAVHFHPDKVEHLGEEFKKSAHEKFQKVNEAFERIKKARGMK